MVTTAARRMVENGGTIFNIIHEDIRYLPRKKRRKIEFCLMIDASSSMEG